MIIQFGILVACIWIFGILVYYFFLLTSDFRLPTPYSLLQIILCKNNSYNMINDAIQTQKNAAIPIINVVVEYTLKVELVSKPENLATTQKYESLA